MAFQKAERKQVPLKLGLAGPSGTGKTLSSLLIARGIVGPLGKIYGVDTENGSMSLYGDRFDFEVEEIKPPYQTEKYIQAIKEAEKMGPGILIIDSMTHGWAGEGGLLDQKEALDAKPGKQNNWTNWRPITSKHEQFKAAILHSPLDIICTMRSKQDYQQVEREGKKSIEKLGMAPIQRDGWEYEFTTFFDLDATNIATTTKDRTSLFVGKSFKITEETGKMLAEWRAGGIWVAGKKEGDIVSALRQKNNWAGPATTEFMKATFGKERLSTLTKPEYEKLVETVSKPYTPSLTLKDQSRVESGGAYIDPTGQFAQENPELLKQ